MPLLVRAAHSHAGDMPTARGAQPTTHLNEIRTFAHLGPDECWRLIGSHGIGRVVFTGETHTQIVPTTYDAANGTAYFRAPAFGELARRVDGRTASLQVDDIDRGTFSGWSVLMTGTAHRVEKAATVAALWRLGRPHAWFPGTQVQWIALPVTIVRGERVGV